MEPGQGPGKPTQVTPDDAEFQAWKAAQQAGQLVPATGDDAEFKAWQAAQARGSSGTWGNEPAPPSDAAHLLNTFSSIPGVERLEALSAQGASHLAPSMFGGQPISYQQSLNALRGVTGEIDPKTAALERFLGSLATLRFLPKNPMAAGALLGGSDQLLSADQESVPERAAATAGGTFVGGLLGKATDVGVTAARVGINALRGEAPTFSALLLQKQAERAASAAKLYDAAIAEGQGKTATPAIKSFLAEPDIAEIVGELQGTRQFANTPAESPEMLDAVYKTLSDRAGQIKKGLDAVSPTRPNIGRFRGQDIAAAQQQGLAAMDPVMPTYREAVDDFAARSKEMDAIKRGYVALVKKTSGGLPSVNQATKSTPEAFADWAGKKGSNVPAAVQGLLSGVSTGAQTGIGATLKTLGAAPSLLRLVEPDALPIATGTLTGAYGATPPGARKAASLLSLLGLAGTAQRIGGLLSPTHMP